MSEKQFWDVQNCLLEHVLLVFFAAFCVLELSPAAAALPRSGVEVFMVKDNTWPKEQLAIGDLRGGRKVAGFCVV